MRPGKQREKAKGWRADLLHDLHDGLNDDLNMQLVEEVAIYCPSCAAREFDDDGA